MRLLAPLRRLASSIRDLFRRTSIKAVYDDDLPELLASLNLSEALGRGSIKCARCGQVVTLDNLWALRNTGGAIEVICSAPSCTSTFDVDT